MNTKEKLTIIAEIATIVGVCIAAIALIPSIGQWFDIKPFNISTQQPNIGPKTTEQGLENSRPAIDTQQPSLEPNVTGGAYKRSIFLMPYCGKEYNVDSNVPIEIQYGFWAAKASELLEENLKNISVSITLDGTQLYGTLNEQRYSVFELPCWDALTEGSWTYYSTAVEGLAPGKHTVEVTYSYNTVLSDGYDLNRDGKGDEYSGIDKRTYIINSK